MSKYVIIHGQFHEVSDDELMHWKYIKREKVNGKWVYTYKEPGPRWANKGKTTVTVNDTNKLFSDERHISTNSGTEITVNRGKIAKAIDTARDRVHDSIENTKRTRSEKRQEKKQDWEESKERGTEKAKREATKYDGGIVIKNDEYGARKIKATFKDSDYWLDGSTTLDTGDYEITEFRRGKLSRFVDTAKEYIKDRLGYDERDALNIADAKYKTAEKFEKNFQDMASIATSNMGKIDPKDGSIKYTDAEKKRIETLERQKELTRKQTAERGKEASKAADAYFNTTLGKLEKARNTGEEWLDELFGKKKR